MAIKKANLDVQSQSLQLPFDLVQSEIKLERLERMVAFYIDKAIYSPQLQMVGQRQFSKKTFIFRKSYKWIDRQTDQYS